jgi:hypothetical protein
MRWAGGNRSAPLERGPSRSGTHWDAMLTGIAQAGCEFHRDDGWSFLSQNCSMDPNELMKSKSTGIDPGGCAVEFAAIGKPSVY